MRLGTRGLSGLAGAKNKGPFTELLDSDFRAIFVREVVCCLVGVAGCGDGVVREGERVLCSLVEGRGREGQGKG